LFSPFILLLGKSRATDILNVTEEVSNKTGNETEKKAWPIYIMDSLIHNLPLAGASVHIYLPFGILVMGLLGMMSFAKAFVFDNDKTSQNLLEKAMVCCHFIPYFFAHGPNTISVN
jgi:hypothetical protein